MCREKTDNYVTKYELINYIRQQQQQQNFKYKFVDKCDTLTLTVKPFHCVAPLMLIVVSVNILI